MIRLKYIFIHDMENLIAMEEIFEKLEQNSFHSPENPLTLTGIQDLFENTFPLDGKIELVVAELSQNERRNGFH